MQYVALQRQPPAHVVRLDRFLDKGHICNLSDLQTGQCMLYLSAGISTMSMETQSEGEPNVVPCVLGCGGLLSCSGT